VLEDIRAEQPQAPQGLTGHVPGDLVRHRAPRVGITESPPRHLKVTYCCCPAIREVAAQPAPGLIPALVLCSDARHADISDADLVALGADVAANKVAAVQLMPVKETDERLPGEGLPGPHRSREKLDGGWLVRQVQAEAVRFSVLAQAAGRRSFRRHLFWRSRPPCDVTRELRLRGQTGLPSLR
jgi:hypothetical protein